MFNDQLTTATKQMEEWQKPAKEVFDLWVSFFPVAPLFGVEWRFADSMPVPGASGFVSASVKKAPAAKGQAPKPMVKAKASLTVVEKAPAKAAEAAAPKPAVETAPKAAAKVAVKAEAPKPKPAPKAETVKAETPKAEPVKAIAPKTDAPKPAAQAETPKAAAPKRAKDGRPATLLDAAPAKVDDLKLIKGIGPSLEKQLNGLGIYKFEQIAEFDNKALAWVDDNLTAFKGRCFRDDWVGQAKAQLA